MPSLSIGRRRLGRQWRRGRQRGARRADQALRQRGDWRTSWARQQRFRAPSPTRCPTAFHGAGGSTLARATPAAAQAPGIVQQSPPIISRAPGLQQRRRTDIGRATVRAPASAPTRAPRRNPAPRHSTSVHAAKVSGKHTAARALTNTSERAVARRPNVTACSAEQRRRPRSYARKLEARASVKASAALAIMKPSKEMA